MFFELEIAYFIPFFPSLLPIGSSFLLWVAQMYQLPLDDTIPVQSYNRYAGQWLDTVYDKLSLYNDASNHLYRCTACQECVIWICYGRDALMSKWVACEPPRSPASCLLANLNLPGPFLHRATCHKMNYLCWRDVKHWSNKRGSLKWNIIFVFVLFYNPVLIEHS